MNGPKRSLYASTTNSDQKYYSILVALNIHQYPYLWLSLIVDVFYVAQIYPYFSPLQKALRLWIIALHTEFGRCRCTVSEHWSSTTKPWSQNEKEPEINWQLKHNIILSNCICVYIHIFVINCNICSIYILTYNNIYYTLIYILDY